MFKAQSGAWIGVPCDTRNVSRDLSLLSLYLNMMLKNLHSLFSLEHCSSWPRRTSQSINSRPGLVPATLSLQWIYRPIHHLEAVRLNQMQLLFSVASFHHYNMLSIVIMGVWNSRRNGKSKPGIHQILGKFLLIPSQIHGKIQEHLPSTRTVRVISFANSVLRNVSRNLSRCFSNQHDVQKLTLIATITVSNVYMHCDGCERLLNKDFNICSTCHMEGKYQIKVQMHPFNDKSHSILNHTGNPQYLRQSRCPCKNGKACQ